MSATSLTSSLLFDAVADNDVREVKRLLKARPEDANAMIDDSNLEGDTPLR